MRKFLIVLRMKRKYWLCGTVHKRFWEIGRACATLFSSRPFSNHSAHRCLSNIPSSRILEWTEPQLAAVFNFNNIFDSRTTDNKRLISKWTSRIVLSSCQNQRQMLPWRQRPKDPCVMNAKWLWILRSPIHSRALSRKHESVRAHLIVRVRSYRRRC